MLSDGRIQHTLRAWSRDSSVVLPWGIIASPEQVLGRQLPSLHPVTTLHSLWEGSGLGLCPWAYSQGRVPGCESPTPTWVFLCGEIPVTLRANFKTLGKDHKRKERSISVVLWTRGPALLFSTGLHKLYSRPGPHPLHDFFLFLLFPARFF